MNLIDITLLAIALGIDCLVVSFSQGLIFSENRITNSLKLGIVMGLFQGIMPIIGYIGADTLYEHILPYSKWIVFSIFFILGLKFITETFGTKEEKIKCIDLKCLISLGIATSIDALVSGATLRLTQTNIILSCLIIGITSFLMAITGFWSGNKIQKINPKYLTIIGGLILITLGIKAII